MSGNLAGSIGSVNGGIVQRLPVWLPPKSELILEKARFAGRPEDGFQWMEIKSFDETNTAETEIKTLQIPCSTFNGIRCCDDLLSEGFATNADANLYRFIFLAVRFEGLNSSVWGMGWDFQFAIQALPE
jgi:hypothetical protein